MNKAKLIIPITAALMLPLFVSCNNAPASEVPLNTDCCVYRFGTSCCTAQIAYNPTNPKFNKNISTSDITLPNDGKLDGKTLSDVIYKDEKTVELYFGGVLEKDYKGPDTTKVFFKKSAFANPTLGGDLQISLLGNKYNTISRSTQDITLESFGGDFNDNLIGTIQFDDSGKYRQELEAHYENSGNPYTGTLNIEKVGKSSTNNNNYKLTIQYQDNVVITVLGYAIGTEDNIHCDVVFSGSSGNTYYFQSYQSR